MVKFPALAFLVVAVTACDPYWGFRVQVKSPTGQPIADAPVEMACVRREPKIVKTNASGEAQLGGMGSTYPPECTVKVAKDGYAEQQFTFDEACGGDRKNCKTKSREIQLQAPAPAAPAE